MDINTIYYNCDIDQNGIMIDVNNAFAEDE